MLAVPYADANADVRPSVWSTDFALLHGARTAVEVTEWERARGLRSQAKDVRGLRVPYEPPSHALDLIVDGSDDDVRSYLEQRLGSEQFRLAGDDIELELPVLGNDRRPRATGETERVRFRPPGLWGVQAPTADQWWHVVPEGAATTLCSLPLASWQGVARSDEQAVTCPWCRVRMIAVEIVAPPATERVSPADDVARPGEEVRPPTLHEEIIRILRLQGGGPMTTRELADAVIAAGRYRKRDGSQVTPFQISGRTKNYPELFERRGTGVILRIRQDP